MSLGTVGRLLLGAALLLAVVGLVFVILERLGLGRLPGDIVWRRGNVTVYFPLGLMLLLSLILTILLNVLLRR
ncbi:MAG TPA: DUF2905 family protein [Longimicrobiales bacterium]|mgnify:FL=1|jgi:hypothetical protein